MFFLKPWKKRQLGLFWKDTWGRTSRSPAWGTVPPQLSRRTSEQSGGVPRSSLQVHCGPHTVREHTESQWQFADLGAYWFSFSILHANVLHIHVGNELRIWDLSVALTVAASSQASPWTLQPSFPSPSPASSSTPQRLGRSAPAPPVSGPWVSPWNDDFQHGIEHATAAPPRPTSPRGRAPWGGTLGGIPGWPRASRGTRGLPSHGATGPWLRPLPSQWSSRHECSSFYCQCSSQGSAPATFAYLSPTSPLALRWWSWGPAAWARWGCPARPALHGRPWRPGELLRQPGPRRCLGPWSFSPETSDLSWSCGLLNQLYGSRPPTSANDSSTRHSAARFASPGFVSWTELVSAPRQVTGDAQQMQLQLGLLWSFRPWVSPLQLPPQIQRLPRLAWHGCRLRMRAVGARSHQAPNHDQPKQKWANLSSTATSSCNPGRGPCSPGTGKRGKEQNMSKVAVLCGRYVSIYIYIHTLV